MKNVKDWPQWLRWGLPAVAGLVVVWLILSQLGGDDVERVAGKTIDCWESLEASCFLRVMHGAERQLASVNEENLQEFIDVLVRPELAGFKKSGEERRRYVSSTGSLVVSYDYVHPDGRQIGMGPVVTPGDDGAYPGDIVRVLLVASVRAHYTEPGKVEPRGEQALRLRRARLHDIRSDLNRLELKGFAEPQKYSPGWHFVTWDEYIANIDRALAESDAARQADQHRP